LRRLPVQQREKCEDRRNDDVPHPPVASGRVRIH
jgi:hypothetical protein